jgi:uncharacterized protein (TIGR01244 family)
MPLLFTLTFVLSLAAAPQLQKDTIDGIRNYTKVDATIGCAGATDPKAMAAIAGHGYKAVLNLREASESGALIPESKAAAEAAGLTFIHVPFKGSAPDDAVADAFLKVVTNTANQPLFINCGSANRVAALWLVKRMLIDTWPRDKALEEAKAIGLTNADLEAFALAYVAKRR